MKLYFLNLFLWKKKIMKMSISKFPNSSLNDKFCCWSEKSLSFNWLVEIFAKKYGYCSCKNLEEEKNCQNPFPVIGRLILRRRKVQVAIKLER